MRLEWRAEARRDLLTISDYISDHNERAANELVERIEACAERLPLFPFLHRPGRVPGTREAVVHPNYVLVYQVNTDAIIVLRVLHARQRYP